MSESDLCQALDALENDTINLIKDYNTQGIPSKHVSFVGREDPQQWKAKFSQVRNHTNCARSEEIEKQWKEVWR